MPQCSIVPYLILLGIWFFCFRSKLGSFPEMRLRPLCTYSIIYNHRYRSNARWLYLHLLCMYVCKICKPIYKYVYIWYCSILVHHTFPQVFGYVWSQFLIYVKVIYVLELQNCQVTSMSVWWLNIRGQSLESVRNLSHQTTKSPKPNVFSAMEL